VRVALLHVVQELDEHPIDLLAEGSQVGADLRPEFAHLASEFAAEFAHLASEFAAKFAHLGSEFAAEFAHLASEFAAKLGHLASEFAAKLGHLPAQSFEVSSEKTPQGDDRPDGSDEDCDHVHTSSIPQPTDIPTDTTRGVGACFR
jgi:hypothetical protein